MAVALTKPKGQIALDTDWLTALNVSFGIFFGALAAIGLIWNLIHGPIKASHANWSSPLFVLGLIYLGARESNKGFKAVLYVLAVGPISRMVLWVLRASAQTYFFNEIFVRSTWAGLCVIGWLYAIYWLKTKIKRV
ncbi:MAG TPA: hypothetical protein VKR57_00600 [Terriglobales bacterium]|jgi:hypothetical protein|nr:hypothetical protein [Terriglobales bacterium]